MTCPLKQVELDIGSFIEADPIDPATILLNPKDSMAFLGTGMQLTRYPVRYSNNSVLSNKRVSME